MHACQRHSLQRLPYEVEFRASHKSLFIIFHIPNNSWPTAAALPIPHLQAEHEQAGQRLVRPHHTISFVVQDNIFKLQQAVPVILTVAPHLQAGHEQAGQRLIRPDEVHHLLVTLSAHGLEHSDDVQVVAAGTS